MDLYKFIQTPLGPGMVTQIYGDSCTVLIDDEEHTFKIEDLLQKSSEMKKAVEEQERYNDEDELEMMLQTKEIIDAVLENDTILLKLLSSKMCGASGNKLYKSKSILSIDFYVLFNESRILDVYTSGDIGGSGLEIIKRFLMAFQFELPIRPREVVDITKEIGHNLNNVCKICFEELNIKVYRPTICSRRECFDNLFINFEFEQNQYGLETMYKCNFFGHAVKEMKDSRYSADEDIIFYGFDDLLDILDPNPVKLKKLLIDLSSGIEQYTDLLQYEEPYYTMMKWVLTNKMSQMIDVGPVHIENLLCWEKFLVVPNNAEKEHEFQQLKRHYNSYYIFSSTNISRINAILKYGLRTLSGTTRMKHGDVYGNGVYASPDLATTSGYGNVLMLCEVVMPANKQHYGTIYVFDETHIRVRMIILDKLQNNITDTLEQLSDLDLNKVLEDSYNL
jgi:hypothetical protein